MSTKSDIEAERSHMKFESVGLRMAIYRIGPGLRDKSNIGYLLVDRTREALSRETGEPGRIQDRSKDRRQRQVNRLPNLA